MQGLGVSAAPGGFVSAGGSAEMEYHRNGDTVFYEPFPRWRGDANNAAQTPGVMIGSLVWIPAGVTLTKLTFVSATSAAGTPTNWWHALYNPLNALMCSSADQLTAAWAAGAAKDLSIARDSVGGAIASIVTTVTGWHVVATMTAGASSETLRGVSMGSAGISGGVAGNQVPLAQTAGSGLTTTPPGTWVGTATGVAPYCIAR